MKEFYQGACSRCATTHFRNGTNRLLSLPWALIIVLTFVLITTGTAQAKSNVVLNGYTFSDDSANIWENQFFSSYYTAGEPSLYYGSWILKAYGDFGSNSYISEFFDKIDNYKNISCVVYREHGYWPQWVKRVGTPGTAGYTPGYFLGKRYTRYNYLAKDIDGNIHILKSIRPNETDVDDAGLIVEGGTTLMYPAEPAVNQPVYQGYVLSTSTTTSSYYPLTAISNCTSIGRIIKYGLNSDTLKDIVVYLQPGWGVVEMNYNWHDPDDYFIVDDVPSSNATGHNGFSMDPATYTFGYEPQYTPDEVMLHGYVFSTDSSNIWDNKYFGDYNATNIATYTKVLYGYGDFKSYDVGIYFDSFSTANNVDCIVLREHGYIPTGETILDGTTGKNITTFTFAAYTRYNYLAKDINGNIHLLRSVSGNDDLSADAITSAGGTTLIYPGTPVENQLVNNGMVVGINSTIDTFTGCMSIRRGSSPEVTFDYYKPASGLVTSVYNWGSTANGFSQNKNPQISSLPAAGGTNTDTVNTDPTATTGKDDDDDKMWYQCFIDTSTCDNNPANQGGLILLIVSAIISLRAAMGVARK